MDMSRRGRSPAGPGTARHGLVSHKPGDRLGDYHISSPWHAQRVLIAMAISLRAEVIDRRQPTTALDVTIQAGILGLIGKLQRDAEMACILITHDLSVSQSCPTRSR